MIRIRPATQADTPVILDFIRALADYERLLHEVVATEERIRTTLFGEHPAAEVLLAEVAVRPGERGGGEWEPAGFALFFPTYSTFLALPGIHLEDLFVRPEHRGKGVGRALLGRLAALVLERGWGRLEWAVLDWNEPAIGFYRALGARALDDWTTFRITGKALEELAS
jgi:GNAT superfamily N-acetyltransferase